jgi:hypothetical protein
MNGEVLKEVRTHNKASLNRFQREVQTHIDQGVPLLWSVELGTHRGTRNPASATAGTCVSSSATTPRRRRFSIPTPGVPGHELKRMKADDAWTVTTALMSIEPIG